MRPTTWAVTIPEFSNGVVKKRTEVWQGSTVAFPTSQNISKILGEDTPDDIISDVAVQFIKKAPIQALPNLLTCLVCNYWRAEDVNIGSPKSTGRKAIDVKMLQGIAEAAQRSVCGVVFKKGDIVWTCRTCAKDPTSVQCDKCFRKSNHQDHEVFFHRAGGDSGCCDCGDPEAWSISGNCLDHSHPSKTNQQPSDADLKASVPPELTRGLRAVLKGAVGLAVSYTVSCVRGYEKWEDNQFINHKPNTYPRADALVGRLHNDDVHSMDQVVSGLVACAYTRQQAAKLTETVDKEGEATVVNGQANDTKLLTCYRRLRLEAGLLFSMVPDYILALEQRVLSSLQWMLSLGQMSDGLRRIVCEELLCEVGSLYSNASVFGPSEDVESALLAINVFADTQQFPSFLSHLNDPPIPSLPLSGPVFAHPRGGSFDGTHQPHSSGVSSSEETRFSTMDADTDFPNRLIRPFDRCHHNAFGILMMATPFLSKPLKRCTIDIVIKYQHDALFKSCFSQLLTVLYPAICVLHCRNIGTQDSSIFQTTVQVYTANSIVALMASDGVRNRLLPEGGRPIMITKMFMSTFIAVLRDVGCKFQSQHVLAEGETSFLNHHSIRTHRISQICRDMEYVTSDSYFCARLLRGDVDFGMIGDILIVCSLLQCIDSYRRHTVIHVERENDSWQDAANLVLEFESLTTHLVSGALFDPSSRKSDKSSQFSYSKHTDVEEDLTIIRQEGALKCISSGMNRLKAWCDEFGTAEHMYFYSAGTTELFMGHPVVFHGLKRFQVSRSAVSVHLPLHRFICKVVKFASHSNGSLSSALEYLCRYDIAGRVHFADYPLRCLSFTSQVAAGMWRRNGSTAANLAYNYNRAPLSKALRDMDLMALQMSIYTLTPDTLLALVLDRYELSTLLQNYTTFYTPSESLRQDLTVEYKGPLLSEFLKLMIITLTNPPTCLIESTAVPTRSVEGIHLALSREVVHQVLTGVQSAGNMQRVKVMVGHINTVSDSMLSAVIDDVCIRKQASEDGGSRVLVLKPESYALYDPEYLNLSNQQISTAADAVRDHIKAQISEANSSGGSDLNQKFIPLMQLQAIPIACEEFSSLRTVMYRPLFFTLLQRSLRIVMDNPTQTSSSRVSIVSRVIHLVTLQILCRDTAVTSPFNSSYVSRDVWTHGARYFMDAFKDTSDNMEEDPEPTGPVMVRSNSNLTKLTSAAGGVTGSSSSALTDLAAAMSVSNGGGTSSSSTEDVDLSLVGAGRHLLSALADVWNAGIVKEDLLYHQGLGWILQQIASNSPDGHAVLKAKGISFDVGNASAEDAEKARRAKLRQAAQQRALLESQKRAAAFATSMEDSEDEDEEEDEDDNDAESEEGAEGFVKVEKEVEPECIVCREKKSDLSIGYLCFIQPSNVLKNMMKRNLDFPQLSKLYRVVANEGCTVYAGQSCESRVVMRLHQGDHVLIDHRQGRWVQIMTPVSGWCVLYSNHEDQSAANKKVGKQESKSDDMVVYLHPVQDLLYNKHGGTRLHISHCGHTMHFECWNMLYAANYSRYINGHRSLDYQAMDIERNESLCPFCKSVTNSLIPFVSKRKAADLLPLKAIAPDVSAESSSMTVESTVESSHSLHPFLSSQSVVELFRNPCRSTIEKNAKGDMFIQSCKLLNQLTWTQKNYSKGETEFARLCQNAENSAIGTMRLLHFVWSASAYTIQNLTMQLMKDRSERSGVLSVDAVSEGVTPSAPIGFAEGDATLIFHLLSTLRYAPSWFDQPEDFAQFVSTPLGQLVTGTSVHTFSADCKRVDVLQCSTKDIEKGLVTVPYRAVATAGFPDHLAVSQIQAIALEKGVPKASVYALLKVPLLSQDLHVVLVAAASAASDLQSFQSVVKVLALARLSQILLEPATTGLVGSSVSHSCGSSVDTKAVVNPHEKSDNNGNAMLVDGGSEENRVGGALHSPMTANENRKRLKVESTSQHTEEWLSANKVLIDRFVGDLEGLRQVISAILPQKNHSAVSDAEFADLVLDSWVPYLEFAYLITRSMTVICNNRHSTLPSAVESVDSLCGSTGNKINYSNTLLTAVGVESLSVTLHSEDFQQLSNRWVSQYQSYYGTAASSSSSSSHTEKRTRSNSADVWIPSTRAASVSLSKPKKPSAGSKKKDAKDPRGLLGVAADQNEFDNILSFLAGNSASDLIASNSPINVSHSRVAQTPPEGGLLRRSVRNRAAAAASTAGSVPSQPSTRREGIAAAGVTHEDTESHSAMEEEAVEHSEQEDSEHDVDAIRQAAATASTASRIQHATPDEFEWEEDDHYFYDIESEDDTSDDLQQRLDSDEEEERLLQAAGGEDGDDEDTGEDLEGGAGGFDENLINDLMQNENLIGFDEDSNQLRQEIINYIRSHAGAAGAGIGGGEGRKKLNWRLYGVDPSNEYVDETSVPEPLSSFLTRQPLQGSVSGAEAVFGVNGETLTNAFPDLSHFGMGIRHVQSVFVELPPIYTDLYQMTKFPEGSDGVTLEDPAICLVCGRILNAGNRQSPGTNSAEHHGECTLHTQHCGAGVGVFFLVQACTVLLIRGALSCYYPTFYLDSSGEVNENRNQNRPLFLSAKRYKKLEELYVTHKISKEIARKRSTADSVVRQNWY